MMDAEHGEDSLESANRERTDAAAESTDLRRGDADARTARRDTPSLRPNAPDTAAFPSPKSIRFHSRTPRASLAARLSLPVAAAALLAFLILCVVAYAGLRGFLLGDLAGDAAASARAVSLFARVFLTQHDTALRDAAGSPEEAEFRAGDHWLVARGFVSEAEWAEATGFHMDELAPASIMHQAARRTALSDFGDFLNEPGNATEILGIYIFDADSALLASCERGGFSIDETYLRGTPQSADVRIGDAPGTNTTVAVDYLEDFDPEPVMRGVARIYVDSAPGAGERARLGTAVVILRATTHFSNLRSFLLLLAGTCALLVPCLAAVSWLSARRAVAPLRRLAGDMQAIAEGDYARRAAVTTNDEAGVAAQAFNSMAERLRLARLNEEETSRLESDLALARSIQNTLLPRRTPRIRGLDIHTAYRPAKEIGGDYFDFLPVDDGHMGLVVADAAGKSVPAALVMSTTRAVFRFVAPGGESAAETLAKVNAILSMDIPRGMFVTAYYVILDPRDCSLLCASAGHTPLLIARRDGSVELLNPGGIALGFDGGAIFQRSIRESRVRLEPGDRVLLYTDGVVECVNPAHEEYSDRRLREFVRRNRELSSHDFVGALMADLDRHRASAEMRDDTTIVTFRAT